ncbi:exosortase A-associated hydrolase 1 [Stakelama sediminis]|uniref:Exosortase A-associated hydrolase 1 n=1 Tax=Stakelama sediminis TaxID=463200 RepID=A0A840YUE4_9SPHN|nr:exosortase A-associated hydrolase 1 [Stakelama sediminis]
MRRLIEFPCAGETLMGSLDKADGKTGLLIVSGGNELRMGAHRGMALLAQAVANAGYPVFRFDARGIGDSTGENHGFEARGPDIAAAAATFRAAAPHMTRLVAFGNCDAASALLLHPVEPAFDALLLANPWVVEQDGDDPLPPASAIRARYAAKLKDPREWLRLLRGGVNIKKLVSGLRKASSKQNEVVGGLAGRVVEAIGQQPERIRLLLAEQDNTAIAFTDTWKRAPEPLHTAVPLHRCPTASHSFAREADKNWLTEQVLAALTS